MAVLVPAERRATEFAALFYAFTADVSRWVKSAAAQVRRCTLVNHAECGCEDAQWVEMGRAKWLSGRRPCGREGP